MRAKEVTADGSGEATDITRKGARHEMEAIGIDIVARGARTGRNGGVPRGRERGDDRDITFRHHAMFDQEPEASFLAQSTILEKLFDVAGCCPIE
jgi:hypothetical protein